MKYPIFYKSQWGYVAVFHREDAFELQFPKHGEGDGFRFRTYKSRAKVKKLEMIGSDRLMQPDEFFKECSVYMQSHLNRVRRSLISSLPDLQLSKTDLKIIG